MKKQSLIKNAFFCVALLSTSITMKAQCPDGSTVTDNDKFLFLTWNTPPATLPTDATIVATGKVYNYQSGTGTVADPALYRNSLAGAGACNAAANFSGQLVLSPGGQPCTFVNGGQPLPITLVDFSVKAAEPGTASLNWEITSAKDFRHFEVERSNGSTFQVTGVVPYDVNLLHYAYTDRSLTNNSTQFRFRLKMVDIDGQYRYSPVRTVFMRSTDNTPAVFPNPATGTVTINGLKTGELVQVYDIYGRLVINKTVTATQENLDISSLPSGTYSVTIKGNTERITTIRLVKTN